MISELFKYGFIVRGFEAGLIVALICPLIGIFLVLRRYALIADTISHVSLAGIALGLLLKLNPLLTALLAATLSSIFIEKLRLTKRIYGESALAILLSGSLALAVVLISLAKGFNSGLFGYLFGSLVTVKQEDINLILSLGVIVLLLTVLFFKELVFITFDEEAAQVAGIPVKFINIMFITMAGVAVTAMIPVVGILLVSALIVMPVVSALQFGQSFKKTIIYAQLISAFSVILGIVSSYYLDLAAGGTIVVVNLIIFLLSLTIHRD